MSSINMIIGNRIRRAREDAQLSQREVAELLGLGQVGFGDIERGKNQASVEYLMRLSDILARPVTYFLGLDDDTPESKVEADAIRDRISRLDKEDRQMMIDLLAALERRAHARMLNEGREADEESAP